jgi:energy-coupling factor transport system substrate-specific component
VAELLRHRRADGSFERQANWTAFGLLALRAAGRSSKSTTLQTSARWLAQQQNTDGGFSFATRGGGSFVDETGAALQGLAAAGQRRGRAVTRALAYLRKAQNQDGGFGQSEGYRSNAQSTAWAIQGMVAVGRRPSRFGREERSPLAFLASLRAADGSYRYSRSSTQTPVWVTAQAIAAVRRKALPLRVVPRRAARTRVSAKRTSQRKPQHTQPDVKSRRPEHSLRTPPARPAARRALTRPVAALRPERKGSGGFPLVPATAIAAVALVAAAAFAFWRRHV